MAVRPITAKISLQLRCDSLPTEPLHNHADYKYKRTYCSLPWDQANTRRQRLLVQCLQFLSHRVDSPRGRAIVRLILRYNVGLGCVATEEQILAH